MGRGKGVQDQVWEGQKKWLDDHDNEWKFTTGRGGEVEEAPG